LFDRFDMTIEVPEVATLEMLSTRPGEESSVVAGRVASARQRQKARFAKLGMKERINAELSGERLHDLVQPDAKGKAMLEQATEKLRLSMRGYTRVLRVARTIADLEGSEHVSQPHVAEAISYRQLQLGRVAEPA
jgi:magnesium chelatase family protein